jgi:outer membrane protein assembly factor BamA
MVDCDRQRVERWYQGRGYFDAQVTQVKVAPSQAARQTTLAAAQGPVGCERRDDDEGCMAEVTFVVHEGEPTTVRRITYRGHDRLPTTLRRRLVQATGLGEGERFDEALYRQSKEAITAALAEAGYARAAVEGTVRVNRQTRQADVELRVRPGPVCVFGQLLLEVPDNFAEGPIRNAAAIRAGDPYRPDRLADAQRGIFGLGSFGAVLVEPVLPSEGNVVDVRIQATPSSRRHRFVVGGGVQGGELQRGQGQETYSVPQWDLHLVGKYENRALFNGLRRLTIEERPRIIFSRPFPRLMVPQIGNLVRLNFRQAGFPEARTTLSFSASDDVGPDPYQAFLRHVFDQRLGVERHFLRHHLFVSASLANSIYRVFDASTQGGEGPPSDYYLTYFEQQARLDYRDDAQRPHQGFFVQVGVQEAGVLVPSSWDYLRLTADARFYVPLPWGITLAGRFAVGVLFVAWADGRLDEPSQRLGPQELRLRGGGPSSNRGFLPGELGDGMQGGLRRWEASLELRFPLTKEFGLVLFADVGDVSASSRFRFDQPQMSAGLGFRYFTLIGPVRVDLAGRIPGAQVAGKSDERQPDGQLSQVNFGFAELPGAVHFSIGQSF